MKRYIIKPRAADIDIDSDPDAENYLSRTVYEPDSAPQPTGLFDANGNELYAIDEREAIGFVRWKA